MKCFTFALALLAACATSDPTFQLSAEPTLGATLPISAPSNEGIVAAAAQMWRSYRVRFQDVRYVVGVDETHRIRYIETNDGHFRTREGLSVGATLPEVLAAGGAEPLHEPGWGRYSRLQSGWCAYFGIPEPGESGTPRVLSYFRRD